MDNIALFASIVDVLTSEEMKDVYNLEFNNKLCNEILAKVKESRQRLYVTPITKELIVERKDVDEAEDAKKMFSYLYQLSWKTTPIIPRIEPFLKIFNSFFQEKRDGSEKFNFELCEKISNQIDSLLALCKPEIKLNMDFTIHGITMEDIYRYIISVPETNVPNEQNS